MSFHVPPVATIKTTNHHHHGPTNNSTNHAINYAKRNDISEKELSECDREKLHLLGHIQGDSGNVLFFSYPEGRILAADANIRNISWIRKRGTNKKMRSASYSGSVASSAASVSVSSSTTGGSLSTTGASAEVAPISDDEERQQRDEDRAREMLGSYLQYWIPYELYLELFEAVETMKKAKSTRTFHFYQHRRDPHAITLSTTSRDCSVIGVEIESVDGREATSDFYSTLVSLGRVMEFYVDEKIVTTACDTIFKLLKHYDRGMVYQFNDDNSGEVVHEIKKNFLTSSYMGMRFPAGDIPLPARQLYIKNGLRYIHDAEANDIPILDWHEPASGAASASSRSNPQLFQQPPQQHNNNTNNCGIDLSHCRMRAVAKPHIIYLRNMGVVSSMSIAVVVENKLWGLIAFHGYKKPFKPSLHQRIACETIVSMVSVKVEALKKKAQSVRIIELSETLMRWVQDQSVASNLEIMGQDILHVVDAEVLVGKIQDPKREDAETVVVGNKALAPKESIWSKLFSTQPNRKLCCIDTRKGLDELGIPEDECPACGIVYFRDGLVQVILGRGLRSRDVRWGGNPDEPKLRIGGILNPRQSFETFMEKAKKESRSWSTSDFHVVSSLMDRVCEHAHNRMMSLLKTDIEDANKKYYNAITRARENNNFFAQMSHEIRTPFHGVMGCLNMLDESRKDMKASEIKDLINTALSSGAHMLQLLDDIVHISKNKYMSHSINQEKYNYHLLAAEATQSLKSLALSKNIQFGSEVRPQHDYIVIITDKTKVVQVVSNIINNAIKFSPEGRIDVHFQLAETLKDTIRKWGKTASNYAGTVFTMNENEVLYSVPDVESRVAAMPVLNNRGWMLVSVTDSGCGMEPNELAEMLKPYIQSSNQKCKAIQGTGLGLFICVSLCQQMKGFLACSSTPGKGSVFHVAFPVGTPDPLAVETGESEMKEIIVEQIPLPAEIIPLKGPIIVCDDNKVNLKILHRALSSELKKKGLTVDIIMADGGQKAVDLYKAERPSVLFIDYHMPEVDGVQATEMIRRFEADNGLKPSYIISYTADVTEKAAQLLLSRGTNEIMSKPPPKGFLSDITGRFEMVP